LFSFENKFNKTADLARSATSSVRCKERTAKLSQKKRRTQMTENKKTAVFGIYPTLSRADGAVDALVKSGFPATAVSALLPENLGPKTLGTEKASKAPEGAAAGATSGAVLGGALGLLAGIGALAVPGVGPLIAAGPILATLAGVGVGGAVGGFTGALIGLGIPEYEAKRYEGRMQKGAILVSVHCDTSEEIKLAKRIMKNTGGEDISSSGESSVDSSNHEQEARKEEWAKH
jgi:hypothetical protein